jgi:hypothetical protein
MKNFDKKYEKLSEYLDGELSPEENSELEKEIAVSRELQVKLSELKKIKELTKNSLKRVADSPYFETKLFANFNAKKTISEKFRKWIPAFGITLFTLAIMALLKFNPEIFDSLVEDQKGNIAGFYKENLKPLLITAGLTNEDIFNFALHRELPLDRNNKQFLKLGSSSDGKEYFEIKTASFISEEDNFEKFVQALELNQKQKEQMDSILESYAEEMEAQVLVNENNTVAINPNLWNYNKAIFADIMAFAEGANKTAFAKVVPAGYTFYDKPTVKKIINEIKSRKDDKYIFFTPDTIFTDELIFEKKEFEKEMDKMKQELKRNLKEAEKIKQLQFEINMENNFAKLKHDSSWNNNFRVYFDSNSCVVQLSDIEIPVIEMPDFDSLNSHIEELTKNLNFSFSIPEIEHLDHDFKIRVFSDDSLKTYNYNYKLEIPVIPNIDSLMNLEMRDSAWLNYNFANPDSLLSGFKFFMNDSFYIFDREELEENMEEFKLEMKKFREEMQEFRREFRPDSMKTKRKSIEI